MSTGLGRPEVAIGAHKALVDVLVDAGFADDRSVRSLMVSELRQELRQPLTVSDQLTARDQLIEIVGFCSRVDEGMGALVSVLELMRPGSPECLKARLLVATLPVQELFSESDLVMVKDWFAGLVPPRLPSLVQRAARHSAQSPPRFDDAWSAFFYLTDLNTSPGELPPALTFAELVAAGCPEVARLRLREWTSAQAHRLHREDALRTLRIEIDQVRPERERLHLVIVIRPDQIEPGCYRVCAWRQDEPDLWPPPCGKTVLVRGGDLESHVDSLVAASEEAWSGRAVDVALEFVLPRALVNTPVHLWSEEIRSGAPQPLHLSYPIVIRSLERMAYPRWHRRWRVRWSALQDQPVLGRVYFCQEKDTEEQHRLDAILSDEHWVAMVLTGSPSSQVVPGRDQLLSALRAGLPALVWHPTASADAMQKVVSWLVDDDRLSDLPARTQASRQAAFRNRQGPDELDVLRDLVIMWDDPGRLLFLADPSAYSA
ncbi:hypothetical protein [Amycolatopsis sp. NPDC098790]|uniref:VMAP-C domain-containing protein n=1 Tax=Amycolatopsis sp. NPDC098790 TaxID=3363939 RepID=UPI0037FA0D8E